MKVSLVAVLLLLFLVAHCVASGADAAFCKGKVCADCVRCSTRVPIVPTCACLWDTLRVCLSICVYWLSVCNTCLACPPHACKCHGYVPVCHSKEERM